MSKYQSDEPRQRKPKSAKPKSAKPRTEPSEPRTIKAHQKNIILTLNQEQMHGEQIIHENDITILVGRAGSGKTLLACKVALDYLLKGLVKKIIVIRPAVSTENHGYLKGSLEEKLYPWNLPVIHNFRNLVENQSLIDILMNDKRIEMFTMMFGRGITFCDTFVILDEFQNATDSQCKMMVSRLGIGSKMVICGDTDQIDLKNESDSGLHFLTSLKLESYKTLELKENHRLPIVDKLVEAYNSRDAISKPSQKPFTRRNLLVEQNGKDMTI